MCQDLHLSWRGPFSLFTGQAVPSVFDEPLANQTYGVYFWTIEYAGSHLVNYVGKTYGENSNRTFAVRFAEELKHERSRDLDVDVNLFFRGIRKVIPPHRDRIDRDRIDEVLRAYRLFIAPVPDLGDRAFLKIEGTLIRTLHDEDRKYAHFLKNPRCNRSYFGRISMDKVDALGLEALVDESDREEPSTGVVKPVLLQSGSEDSMALHDIRRFLSVPWQEHGARRTTGEHKGWYEHDWGDLVQRISYIDYGHIQDIPAATEIAGVLRRRCRTRTEWERLRTDQEEHEEIIALVRNALAAIEGPPTPQKS